MAKQQKLKQTPPVKIAPRPIHSFLPFSDFRTQAIVIALLGILFYANSYFNEFALDDGIVIIKNEYVQEGLKGLPAIFSKDAYDSFYRSMNAKDQLSGGRYRPLSIATFALEQEFIGTNDNQNKEKCWDTNQNGKMDPEEDLNHDGLWNENDCSTKGMHFRHLVNILLFAGSGIILLYFLRKVVFPIDPDIAFIATLLFVIHPIHTEVVANVKSRDEIMSLLFILLTFIFAFRYKDDQQRPTLIKALLCYFLALLSKEYAITLIALLPLSFFIIRKEAFGQSVKSILPYGLVVGIYLFIRYSSVVFSAHVPDNEVLNNPYLFARGSQKLATEIATTFNYFKLLVFPHPLSSDYSYRSIPYKDFTHPLVWLSLAFHISLIVLAIRLLLKRHIVGFAIAFYLVNLFMICNIFLNIGATMGERLIYHSSLGFTIVVAYLAIKGLESTQLKAYYKKTILFTCLLVIIAVAGYATIQRNADWKNDITLFTKDVNTVPESALANGNAGARYIDLSERPANKANEKELLYKAISYLDKAIQIHPRYVTSYINRGLAYYQLGEIDKTAKNWAMVQEFYPHYPDIPRFKNILANAYLNRAFENAKAQKFDQGIVNIEKGLTIDSNFVELWYNLGGLYFTIKDYPNAKHAWEKTLQLKPDHKLAQQGYAALIPLIKPNK